jgi:VanZ family protein
MTRAIHIFLLFSFIVLLAALVIFADIPERTRFWQEFFTAGHTLVFGLSALALLRLCHVLMGDRIQSRLMHYVIAFILSALVGAATELIQPYVGRDCELADFVRDLLGAAAFLCTAMTFDSTLTWEFPAGKAVRYLVRIAAPVLILLIFWPALNWGGSYLYRDRQLPLLAAFDSSIMQKFIRLTDCKLTVTDAPAEWGGQVGKVGLVTFHPAIYPGIMFRELSPNWSAYEELRFGIFSARSDTVSLELRINDRHHTEKYSDRFNTVLKIIPGDNPVVISLDNIRKSPSRRQMDMREMGTIILFAHRPIDSFSVYLTDLRLK